MSDNNKKLVLILEQSNHILESNQADGDVFLEGIFAQFGVVNNNDRLYEESEYLPHLEYLHKKIKENRLLGELDHPEKFDISLSKTSHVIESLEYDKATRQIKGRVKLLNTPSGRIAKDLVAAGVPISISSRAAGLVESNKKVKIKKIFTYDLVADPGFENAVLSRMNESLGIHSDLIAVYDMTEKYPELLEENQDSEDTSNVETSKTNKQEAMEFVTTDEMNAYSLFVKEEIEKLQEKFSTLTENNQNTEVALKIEEMNGNVDKIQKYLDYIAETSDKTIQYTEYVAERLDKVIEYTNYVAKTLDESIAYTEHVAEKADQGIQYTEYMKESVEKGIAYSEYLKECLEKTVDYAEHIAEKADQGIQYSEYLAEKAEETAEETEALSEKMNQAIAYTEYLGENLSKGIAYSEYLAEQTQAVADYVEFSVNEAKTTVTTENIKEQVDYTSIPNKVDELIESIKKQKTDKVNESITQGFVFMNLLSEDKKEEFRALDESKKQKVSSALKQSSPTNEGDILKIWEAVLTPHVEKWLEEAPEQYKQLWESLDEKSKNTLLAQSRAYKLETAYQIKNFWETRPASILKKSSVQTINEGVQEAAQTNPLGYSSEYVKMIGSLLGK